jgi:plastocyanin
MRTIGLTLAILAGTASMAAAEPTGRVSGKVMVTEADGKPATGVDVIVYVVGPAATPAEAGKPVKTTIKQEGRRFIPDLVGITVNDSVDFPNFDNYMHNVFSQSPGRKFDLGSMKKGDDAKSKQFSQAGVIDVYCNIHPEMAATILVLPNHWHTKAKPDGSFSIDNVPVGNWKVFAYARRATKPASADVKVGGGDAPIQLSLQRGAEADHLNKYGEKYKPGGKTYP